MVDADLVVYGRNVCWLGMGNASYGNDFGLTPRGGCWNADTQLIASPIGGTTLYNGVGTVSAALARTPSGDDFFLAAISYSDTIDDTNTKNPVAAHFDAFLLNANSNASSYPFTTANSVSPAITAASPDGTTMLVATKPTRNGPSKFYLFNLSNPSVPPSSRMHSNNNLSHVAFSHEGDFYCFTTLGINSEIECVDTLSGTKTLRGTIGNNISAPNTEIELFISTSSMVGSEGSRFGLTFFLESGVFSQGSRLMTGNSSFIAGNMQGPSLVNNPAVSYDVDVKGNYICSIWLFVTDVTYECRNLYLHEVFRSQFAKSNYTIIQVKIILEDLVVRIPILLLPV